MPVLTGPGNLSPTHFTVANDGLVSLTNPPLPAAGGTVTGPVVIKTNVAPTLPAPPPGTLLQLGATDGVLTTLMIDSFATNSTFQMRRANGTAALPTKINNGDTLSFIGTAGYGAAAYSGNRTAIVSAAGQDWTDTAQGASLRLETTPNGTASRIEAVRITDSGNVGIGTSAPGARLTVNSTSGPPQPSISNPVIWAVTDAANPANVVLDHYGTSASSIIARKSNGTIGAPTAVLNGNQMLILAAQGRGATGYYAGNSATINFQAMENWTDTANGSSIFFQTTANGTTGVVERMRIDHNGNIMIGDTGGATQRLTVMTSTDNTLSLSNSTLSGTQQASIYFSQYRTPVAAIKGDTYGNGRILFYTNGDFNNAKVTIDPLGNLIVDNANMPVNFAPTSLYSTYISVQQMIGFNCYFNVGANWIARTNNDVAQINPAGGVWAVAGTTSPPAAGALVTTFAQRFQIRYSDGVCLNTSGTWSTISDVSTKSNVQPYERGLEAILELNPITFVYNERSPYATEEPKVRHGLVAQEVEPFVPEAVGEYLYKNPNKKDAEEVTLSTLDPGLLIFVLINAMKTVAARLDALESATVH